LLIARAPMILAILLQRYWQTGWQGVARTERRR
jgi:hypothetical protein